MRMIQFGEKLRVLWEYRWGLASNFRTARAQVEMSVVVAVNPSGCLPESKLGEIFKRLRRAG